MNGLGIDIGGSSVKAALMPAGTGSADVGRSMPYERPSLAQLERAIAEAVGSARTRGDRIDAVGVCVPGLYDEASRAIVSSVNIPALDGARPAEWIGGIVGISPARVMITSDARAGAHDWATSAGARGRLAAISVGTGVGLCVLDGLEALRVDGPSSGHLGQLDVSFEANPADAPIGPDGGRGGLEAYVGGRVLAGRFGMIGGAGPTDGADPALRAMARAIRAVHAIYRPDEVVLLGGVAVTYFSNVVGTLRALVADGLTRIARPDWRLTCARDAFHGARGAARLAADRFRSAPP